MPGWMKKAAARRRRRLRIDRTGRTTFAFGGWPPGNGLRSYTARRVRVRTLRAVAHTVYFVKTLAPVPQPEPSRTFRVHDRTPSERAA